MAGSGTKSSSGRELKRVTTTYQVRGGARRGHPGITVSRSGRALTNVEGGELFLGIIKQSGQDPRRCQVAFGVDEENAVIGVSVVPAGTPGSMPARPSGDDRTIAFHLGGVFAEHPKLRPVGSSQYAVTVESDADGAQCLMIDMNSGVATRTVARVGAENPGPALQ